MHDDDLMDRLLKDALAGEAPRLSLDFDARVMRRLRPRRLTPVGLGVIAVYGVVAVVTVTWFSRGLPLAAVGTALVVGATLAASASAYARHLAFGT